MKVIRESVTRGVTAVAKKPDDSAPERPECALFSFKELSYTDTSPKCHASILIHIRYFDTPILLRYHIRNTIQYNKIIHDTCLIHLDTLSILHNIRTRRKI
jgi:hypothetical protein